MGLPNVRPPRPPAMAASSMLFLSQLPPSRVSLLILPAAPLSPSLAEQQVRLWFDSQSLQQLPRHLPWYLAQVLQLHFQNGWVSEVV